MRIGIISDTHDQVARTGSAVAALVAEGAEALIHCGDYTVPDVVHECGVLPAYFVFGNNDDDEPALRAAMEAVGGRCLDHGGEIVLGGRRIAVVHGDVARQVRDLAAAQPDYLLFGHSHATADERAGRTRWINPGALYRAPTWTVALLDVSTDVLKFLKIR